MSDKEVYKQITEEAKKYPLQFVVVNSTRKAGENIKGRLGFFVTNSDEVAAKREGEVTVRTLKNRAIPGEFAASSITFDKDFPKIFFPFDVQAEGKDGEEGKDCPFCIWDEGSRNRFRALLQDIAGETDQASETSET